jgi:hypothetical protein
MLKEMGLLKNTVGVARAYCYARVFNEGNFVARVFDVFFNNAVPITQ